MLETYLRERLKKQKLLLMTHIVAGYPNFDESMRTVEEMVRAGVDLMELQIPFSEPMADGPVILHANQVALRAGSTVEKCLSFADEVTKRFDIPFLLMSYYNILFKRGLTRFAARMKEIGLRGAIVPDLPPEEAEQYISALDKTSLAPIFLYAPNTPRERMNMIAKLARGFVYCVARKGVTGSSTEFSAELAGYLQRCRQATDLPLAVGFGVKERSDVDFLRGKADIAVIGSQMLRLIADQGTSAIRPFLESLR